MPALSLHFHAKLRLPVSPEIRYCASDNFLFVAAGCQADYDEYYATVANDTYHQELSAGGARSPIARLQSDQLVGAVPEIFFDSLRRVMDFGCGEASLVIELAIRFPDSTFIGFDPGPAARVGLANAKALGLSNVKIADLESTVARGPFDLITVSHVAEHLLEFEAFQLLESLLAEDGLLYVEVPDALRYETFPRSEFLYYFDRLHVNHFTPQSLHGLGAAYGLASVKVLRYSFPYREGGQYPALGMLFRKGAQGADVTSPDLLQSANRYIAQEKQKAAQITRELAGFPGVLVWGAGDNFFRSMENGGPLAGLNNIVVLDRRPFEISIGGRTLQTVDPHAPHAGVRAHDWPVVVTVSEGRHAIAQQVEELAPGRQVFFV